PGPPVWLARAGGPGLAPTHWGASWPTDQPAARGVGEVAITVLSLTFWRRNRGASWASGPAPKPPRSQNHNQKNCLDAHAHAPTCSDCDIRTAKSPSNVIGRKHLPSVTKIPQGSAVTREAGEDWARWLVASARSSALGTNETFPHLV